MKVKSVVARIGLYVLVIIGIAIVIFDVVFFIKPIEVSNPEDFVLDISEFPVEPVHGDSLSRIQHRTVSWEEALAWGEEANFVYGFSSWGNFEIKAERLIFQGEKIFIETALKGYLSRELGFI